MASGDLVSLLPLVLVALVPASLFIAAFLTSRQRSRALTVAAFMTTAAAGLAYVAVVLHALLSVLGYGPRTAVPSSVLNDVVQLDLVSSAMFVLVSTLAVVVVRYSR